MQVLMCKSRMGYVCTKLFLDWYNGKITKEQFVSELELLRRPVENKQLCFNFGEEFVRGDTKN